MLDINNLEKEIKNYADKIKKITGKDYRLEVTFLKKGDRLQEGNNVSIDSKKYVWCFVERGEVTEKRTTTNAYQVIIWSLDDYVTRLSLDSEIVKNNRAKYQDPRRAGYDYILDLYAQIDKNLHKIKSKEIKGIYIKYPYEN